MSNTLSERRTGKTRHATGYFATEKKNKGVMLKMGKPSLGLVKMYLEGATGKVMAHKFKPSTVISGIQSGLAFQELNTLQTSLNVSMPELAAKLGISKATLQRRKSQGRFGPAESDRLLRFARLMGKAVEVMETEDNARRWLNAPQKGLGGAIPLNYAETEIGAREVEDLLGRIEYGVYS